MCVKHSLNFFVLSLHRNSGKGEKKKKEKKKKYNVYLVLILILPFKIKWSPSRIIVIANTDWVNPSKSGGMDEVFQGLAEPLRGISQGQSWWKSWRAALPARGNPFLPNSFTWIYILFEIGFHQLGPLGRVGLAVDISVCLCVCVCVCLMSPSHAIFF